MSSEETYSLGFDENSQVYFSPLPSPAFDIFSKDWDLSFQFNHEFQVEQESNLFTVDKEVSHDVSAPRPKVR